MPLMFTPKKNNWPQILQIYRIKEGAVAPSSALRCLLPPLAGTPRNAPKRIMTIREFKSQTIKSLTQPEEKKSQHNSAVSQTPAFVASSTPSLDVEILLCHFLSLDKTHLLLNQNQEIPVNKLELLEDAVKKRQTGLPIAYITNHKEFYGYDFYVTPDVLIPKPDTEILVEKAVLFLEEKILANPDRILTVCDMCTGSGCIGISVLKSLYQDKKIPLERLPKFTLVDISQKALDIAKKNADSLLDAEKPSYAADSNSGSNTSNTTAASQKISATNGSHNPAAPAISLRQKIRFVQSNLFELLPYQFDVVLTNPPYVPSSLTDELLKDGRSEPRLALDGDITITGDKSDTDDGLEIIRNLMPQISEHTTPTGFFLMETGEYNMKGAENLAYRAGFRNSKVFLDLEGQERVLFGEK